MTKAFSGGRNGTKTRHRGRPASDPPPARSVRVRRCSGRGGGTSSERNGTVELFFRCHRAGLAVSRAMDMGPPALLPMVDMFLGDGHGHLHSDGPGHRGVHRTGARATMMVVLCVDVRLHGRWSRVSRCNDTLAGSPRSSPGSVEVVDHDGDSDVFPNFVMGRRPGSPPRGHAACMVRRNLEFEFLVSSSRPGIKAVKLWRPDRR